MSAEEIAEYIEYPTDNDWGIPALPLSAAATAIPLPILCWGAYPRSRWHPGTTHYYTEDYRYHRTHLTAPSSVVVEPNYSWDGTRASTMATTLKKRQLAWLYAQQGASIIVDLYVPPDHLDIALLGIPHGWTAYAWRAHRDDPATMWDARYAAAQRHAGDRPILVLVVGGGRKAMEWCNNKTGVIWHTSNAYAPHS